MSCTDCTPPFKVCRHSASGIKPESLSSACTSRTADLLLMRCLFLSLLCSGARRMGRPHPPLCRAAPSRHFERMGLALQYKGFWRGGCPVFKHERETRNNAVQVSSTTPVSFPGSPQHSLTLLGMCPLCWGWCPGTTTHLSSRTEALSPHTHCLDLPLNPEPHHPLCPLLRFVPSFGVLASLVHQRRQTSQNRVVTRSD